MLIDTSNIQFWIIGLLWFTAPILSWLWSLVAIKRFKDLNTLVPKLKEMQETLEKTRQQYELACSERLESLNLKAAADQLKLVAEKELKAASSYYIKIKKILEKT